MTDFDDTLHWDDPPTPPTGLRNVRSSRNGHRIERTRTHHVVTARPADEGYDDLGGDWSPVDHWVETEPRRARPGCSSAPSGSG